MNTRKDLQLDLIGYKIVMKLYSQVRMIFAELGESDTLLLRALRDGHGIQFNSLIEDPMLYFVVGSDQMEALKESGAGNPTFLQLLGTCEVIDTNKERAMQRFEKLKRGE
jgi:hypothetical protein